MAAGQGQERLPNQVIDSGISEGPAFGGLFRFQDGQQQMQQNACMEYKTSTVRNVIGYVLF